MTGDFLHTAMPCVAAPVFRLGLSASYWPGRKTIYRAIDEGVNFFFCYGFDRQMIGVLRDVLRRERERYVVATGAYNLGWGRPNMRKSLEKRLRQLGTDYIDAFLFLGVMKPERFPDRVQEEMRGLCAEGKIGGIGLSTHQRKFAGELAAQGAVDFIMMRYNAAHRGAEQDIFPRLMPHNPAVISYTATRWTSLLRAPRGWGDRVPDAGMCYRFVLSNDNVHVCLTAPKNVKQLRENLDAVRRGPLEAGDLQFMHRFGDAVRSSTLHFYSREERRARA